MSFYLLVFYDFIVFNIFNYLYRYNMFSLLLIVVIYGNNINYYYVVMYKGLDVMSNLYIYYGVFILGYEVIFFYYGMFLVFNN